MRQGRDALANLTQGEDTQTEQTLIRRIDPPRDRRVRFRLYKFGDNVGIEQESAHRSTIRPYSGVRSRSTGTFARGDSAKNLARLRGCFARPVRRSNSSAGSMTTASLSWRVIH